MFAWQVEQILGRGKELHVSALRYDVEAQQRDLQRIAAKKGAEARIKKDWTQVGKIRESGVHSILGNHISILEGSALVAGGGGLCLNML